MTNTTENANSNSIDSKIPHTKMHPLLRWVPPAMGRLEKFVEWIIGLFPWLPWTLFVGMLPGLTVWQIFQFSQEKNLFENEISLHLTDALYPVFSSLLYLGLCLYGYRRLGASGFKGIAAFCQKINRFGAACLVLPVFLFLRSHPISEAAPVVTILLCLATGMLAAVIVYGIPRLRGLFTPGASMQSTWGLALVLVLAAMWAAAIIHMELIQHASLKTCDWDFGLYINTMWQTLQGNLLGCSLNSAGSHAAFHFDPILILLAPVLLFYQGPESLIVLQGIWVAAGAIPLYLLASRQGQNTRLGVVMAVVYLLHPAFHGPAMYDFHSLILAGPLMLWCLHFLEAGAPRRFFIFLGLLLLTREDMSGIAFLIGLYAFISGKSRRTALVAMLISLTYGLVIYLAIMQHGHSYGGYFKDFHGENRSVVANIAFTAVTNPLFLLKLMLTEKKWVYIAQLLAPMLFLPAFAPKHRVLYLGGLGITLLGTKDCLTNISMQYSTWWLPFMLAAVPAAIDHISQGKLIAIYKIDVARFRTALVAGMLLSALAMSTAFGAFLPNPSFRAGYDRLSRELDSQQWKRAKTVEKIKKMIPPDAKVMASQHLVPHFATRKWIWSVDRNGYRVGEPDFAILWKRDLRSKKPYKVKPRKRNMKMLKDPTRYRRVLHENDISLYERLPED